MVADRRRIVPRKSTLLNWALEKLWRNVSGLYDEEGRPWWGKFVGIAMKSKTIATAPAGTLERFSTKCCFLLFFTYFNRKTHLQVV